MPSCSPLSPTGTARGEGIDPPHKILIIGAGTTALLLAHGLLSSSSSTDKKKKIPIEIYERHSQSVYRTRAKEWGMALDLSDEAISRLALSEELKERMKRECRSDPYCEKDRENNNSRGGERGEEEEGGIKHFNGKTGEEIFREESTEKKGLRVSRRKMRALFSEGLDIQYGKSLVSITQEDAHIRAIFHDGHVASGSLLIGCDGAKSVVRELLVGREESEVTDMDISLFNFSCQFDADTSRLIRAVHPVAHTVYHPNGWMLSLATEDVPDVDRPESWSYQLMWSCKHGPKRDDFALQAERTDFLRAKAKEYAEPWRTILSRIPDDVSFNVDRVHTWRPFPWSDVPLARRVTLAGDAAHAEPPHGGQNLKSGLEDAALLTEYLSQAAQTDLAWGDAVQRYEQDMMARALPAVAKAEETTHAAHDFEKITRNAKPRVDSPLIAHGRLAVE